jgi:hypothetical protein
MIGLRMGKAWEPAARRESAIAGAAPDGGRGAGRRGSKKKKAARGRRAADQ